jgi:hypothetical protein
MLFGAWFLAEGGRLALQRSKARFGSVSALRFAMTMLDRTI